MDLGFAGSARWLIAETWAENYSSLRKRESASEDSAIPRVVNEGGQSWDASLLQRAPIQLGGARCTGKLLSRSSSRVLALDILQASCLATQAAKIIKLCASHFGRAHHIHLINYARSFGEDALNTLAEADLAHRETGLRSA